MRDQVVLISGFDDTSGRGGLFVLDGDRLERLDELASTGLSVRGDTLARMLRNPPDQEADGTFLLVYDQQGRSSRFHLEEVVDPHDILWTGDAWAIACAGANKIVWVSDAGKATGVWKAPGEGDAWHLNSLLLVDGELCLSAFGRFARHREWMDVDTTTTGFVLNLATGAEVVGSLASPHHPRLVDGKWLVCNSGTAELLQVDAQTGAVDARIPLAGWARGLAVLDDYLLVGESPGRSEEEDVTATVAFVDRTSMSVARRLAVPVREIYDIVAAPRSLVEGVRLTA